MAPPLYIDTIATYQEGNKQIADWLVEAARRCGTDVNFLDNSGSKTQSAYASPGSKTGKKSTPKYLFPTREYPRLASTIASSSTPKIRLPKRIVALLHSVICLRQRATKFHEKLPSKRPPDDGHRHFISVLERVLEILQPAGNSESEEQSSLGSFTNLFETLRLEEPDEDTEPAVPPVKHHNKPQKQQGKAEFEVEAAPPDEDFAVFAFFEDLNIMRDYIKKVWQDYRDGRSSIISAAVTTDTAWALLKQSCDQIIQDHYSDGGYYQMMHPVITSSHVGANTGWRDWFCWDAFRILDSWSDLLEKGHNPLAKPGFSVSYDSTCDRESLSDDEKWMEDGIVLMELLPEVAKLSRSKVTVPAEDLLTTGLRKMMDVGSIQGDSIDDSLPMYAIFASQMLLDIHHILRQDICRPFDQLQATGKRVVDTIDDFLQYQENHQIGPWTSLHDKQLNRISALANDWALEDKLDKIIPKGAQGGKVTPFHLLKNQPVLAGLLIFRLTLQLHEAGVYLCIGWSSAFYPLHLYNAAKHSGGLQEPWEDAELIIELHSESRMFVGARPTKPADYEKHTRLALGSSVMNFAPNRRGASERTIISRKRIESLTKTSSVRDIFQDRYMRGKAPVLSVPNIIKMVAVVSRAKRVGPPSIDVTAFAREIAIQKQFTSIELLTAVREGVTGEELHLLFDYLGFHQRGYELLRDLQTHLEGSMSETFEANSRQDDKLQLVVCDVFELAKTARKVPVKILCEAAHVVRSMLKNEDGKTLKAKAMAEAHATLYADCNGTKSQLDDIRLVDGSENLALAQLARIVPNIEIT